MDKKTNLKANRFGLFTDMLKDKQNLASEMSILLALVILCVVLRILTPNFLTTVNLLNILQQISIIAVISVGMTFVIILGGIDLSVGSIVALVGLVMSVCMNSLGLSVGLSILIGVLLGCLAGFVNGFVISTINLPPFIATLGMMSIARGAAFMITNGQPVYGLPDSFLVISGRIGIISIPVIIMIAIFLIAGYILNYTKLGRYTYAIGGNENVSLLSGINVKKYKMMIYTLSGFFCAISAILLTSKLDSAVPVAADGYELEAIASVVIGGTSMTGGEGKIRGTLLGALIIGVLSNGMNLLFIPQGSQRIVKGVIILLAVGMDMMKKRKK